MSGLPDPLKQHSTVRHVVTVRARQTTMVLKCLAFREIQIKTVFTMPKCLLQISRDQSDLALPLLPFHRQKGAVVIFRTKHYKTFDRQRGYSNPW